MTHNKEVTRLIVEYWAIGLSAQETVSALKSENTIEIGIATVYRRRHSLTAQQMVDELIRRQLRDITKEDNSALRMKYRDRLLAKMMPQQIEQKITEKVDVNVTRTEEILKQYEFIIKRRSRDPLEPIQPDDSPEQVHST